MKELPFFPQPKPEKQEKKKKRGLNKMKPYEKKLPQKKKKKRQKKQAVISAERSGIKPPDIGIRNSFSEKEREKALKEFGNTCNDPTCSMTASELHHIVFRSQSGRGVWRNAVPLCISHHEKCHKHKAYAEMWREVRRRLFGEFFYMDKWDLWLMGKIADPEVNHYFEDFMINQEVKQGYEEEILSSKKRRYRPTLEQFGQKRTNKANEQNLNR